MNVYIAVCGPGTATEDEAEQARAVGRLLAEAGAVVVCGGMGGVMDAAAEGASTAGGTVVGILPGATREGASPHLTVSIPTGFGEGRNVFVVRAADAVIAVGGAFGTLSEIALALKIGTPVVGLGTWELARGGASARTVEPSGSPEQAVERALALAGERR
ncbi:MAG TPA: TIGR00725 family protein [Actinomycetota bacterium]|jgi:uncharacterized protein (TIGR00725 family)|nr:TIGR00725 family protein [Actinomycetota bacterium]